MSAYDEWLREQIEKSATRWATRWTEENAARDQRVGEIEEDLHL